MPNCSSPNGYNAAAGCTLNAAVPGGPMTVATSTGCRELETEMGNARAWTGAVIVKRRGSEDVDDWYAIMPAKLWAELMGMLDRPTPRR